MRLVSRPYNDDDDLRRIVDLVIAANAAGQHHWHVGDVLWGMYQNIVFEPRRHIRLWESPTGDVLAFAWFDPPAVLGWLVHPRVRASGVVEEAILTWSEQHRRELVTVHEPEPILLTNTLEDDRSRIAFLEQHGFTRDAFHLLHLERHLEHVIPAPPLPPGWTVRHVAGEHEFRERVALHREVWEPSRVTLEAYRRLRSTPGDLPELDLVAVGPDGSLGAYCICWLNATNHRGEFEPVGTRAADRGQGLGTAVMREGLRRLHTRGAKTAVVYAVFDNTAATRLYTSVGFHVTNRHLYYSKRLIEPPAH